MANVATVLRDEIARVARKETRKAVDPVRKQATALRRDVAALKRQLSSLQRELAQLQRASRRAIEVVPAATPDEGRALRFSPASLKKTRARLGLSATDFGMLVGVSGQTVYNWEGGNSRPSDEHIAKIAATRAYGKRDAQALLATLAS